MVAERAFFRCEQSVGLSATAYLLAKAGVFGLAAVIQSAVLVVVVTAPKIGKHAPSGAAALGSPTLELLVDIAATCVAAAIVGLSVSALAQTSNQILPLMVVTLMAQLVLAAGQIDPLRTAKPTTAKAAPLTTPPKKPTTPRRRR